MKDTNTELNDAVVAKLMSEKSKKDKEIKGLGTVILILIGVIFWLMASYSNPKYSTPEWTGETHIEVP